MNINQKNIMSAIVVIFACCAIVITVMLAQKNLIPLTINEQINGEQETVALPEKLEEKKKQDESDSTEKLDEGNGKETKETLQMLNDEQIKNAKLTTPYYIALGVESLILSFMVVYLIASVENKKSFKETMSKPSNIIIFVLLVAISTSLLTYGIGVVAENQLLVYKSVEVMAEKG